MEGPDGALGVEPPARVSNLELVRWAFAMFMRGDPAGMNAIVTDETVARFPDRTCHGRAEVAKWFEDEIGAIEGWSMELFASAEDGEDVLLSWRMTGTHSGWLEGIRPTGKPVTSDGISHFVIRERRAVKVNVVIDRMQFAVAIGMMGPEGSVTDRLFKTFFNARTKAMRALRREPAPEVSERGLPERPAEAAAGASNLELARWALDRLSRGDASALAALATERTAGLFPEATCQGAAEIRARLEAEMARYDDLDFEVVGSAASGEHVIARWRIRATHTGRFGGIGPTGRTIGLDAAAHMVFRDGRLESLKVLQDRMQFALEIGMMADAGSTTDKALKTLFNSGTRLAAKLAR